MSSSEARIEKLNDAIESLNEDAEEMHGLISRSIEGLDGATEASNKAAENVGKLIDALGPLSETISLQFRDTSAMVEETKQAMESQSSTIKAACAELKKAQEKTFKDFTSKSLKEQEKTRDELQTDMLGFKNATSARLDSLELETTKTTATVKELGEKVSESADLTRKKLIIPVYTAIAIGVVNLICLLLLLLR